VYLGAFSYYPGTAYQDYYPAALHLEQLTGKKLAIIHSFSKFSFPPDAGLLSIVQHGATPMVTLNPDADLAGVAAGQEDAGLRAWGAAIAKLQVPVLVRYMHEMNLVDSSYSWLASRQGAAAYIAAFRHVHDVLLQAGASNAQHVWCPNAYWGAADASNPIWFKPYYPGDGYVDWTCLDGYNFWTQANPTPATFNHIFEDSLRLLEGMTSKPIMLGEFSSVEDAAVPSWKPNWLQDAFGTQIPAHPRVKAAVFFNAPTDGNFLADSSAATLAAFKAASGTPYYLSSVASATSS
jgi:beta-mannanase